MNKKQLLVTRSPLKRALECDHKELNKTDISSQKCESNFTILSCDQSLSDTTQATRRIHCYGKVKKVGLFNRLLNTGK